MKRQIKRTKFISEFVDTFAMRGHLSMVLPDRASRRTMIRMACEAVQVRAETFSFATYGKMIPGGGK